MHEGHRMRMKQKFLKEGLDAFESHEVLEMLLYYIIPQKNTNELAHQLLESFGSFSAVLEAPVGSLTQFKGISESGAVLIKMLPEVSRRYLEDKHGTDHMVVSSEDAGQIFLNKFVGRINETVMLMLMDSKGKLLFCGVVNEGNMTSADIYIRKVVELGMRYNASVAILSHNHPSGVALPSHDDLVATREVKKALQLINIKLIDHIIVADDDFVSIAESNLGEDIFGDCK